MDFDLTERQAFFRDQVRQFVDQYVRPRVADYKKEIDSGDRWQPLQLIEDLKPKAREAGLWNLFMPPGGMNRFQRPASRASGFRPSISCSGCQRSPLSISFL